MAATEYACARDGSGEWRWNEALQQWQASQTREVWGIAPRNLQQRIALDLLLDDSIPLVTLVGRAGTGKTLLALAAALQKTLLDQRYEQIIITRSMVPLGRDLGALPGDKNAKMTPWLSPIYDNMDVLFDASRQQTPSNASNAVLDGQKKRMKEIHPGSQMLQSRSRTTLCLADRSERGDDSSRNAVGRIRVMKKTR